MPLFVLLMLSASPADVDEHIARGRAAMQSLDYDVAADELSYAASEPTATAAQRMDANLLAGIAHVIVGNDALARLSFRYVLLRNPAATLAEDAPQKAASFFALVRMELAAERDANPTVASAPNGRDAPVTATDTAGQTYLPLAVGGAGALMLVTGAGLAGWSEASLTEASLPADDKAAWLLAGRTGLVLGAAGVLLAGGALVVGALE